MTHPFRSAEALEFARTLGLLDDGPGPIRTGPPTTPTPAQPTPPTPPADEAQGDDDGDRGPDEFDVVMLVMPPGGATYRSAITMGPSPDATMLVTAVLQVASGSLAQCGVHTHLFATTPSAGPQPAPAPPYRPADTMRPTPNDVAKGACSCEACTARRNGTSR